MRFIAQYGEYGVQIRPQRQQGMGDGSINVTVEGIYAKFDPEELVFENEFEKAQKTFNFKGQYQHLDEATPVDPTYRLSVFDSIKAQQAKGWTDEEREQVEKELIRKSTITGDFFHSEETPIPAPFKKWDGDEIAAWKLVAMLVEMGGDLGDALAYEKLFGRNRDEVIEALEATIAAPTETAADFEEFINA
jgi:hypothetical protein